MGLALVILAAGKGTRMKSDLPKVLHEIAGAPMVNHVLATAQQLNPDHVIVVTGHGADQVETAVSKSFPNTEFVRQTEQLGTGHAVQQAQEKLNGFNGTVLVLYADSPLFKLNTLQDIQNVMADVDVAVLGFEAADPGRYGRLVVDGDRLNAIVEFKDATDDQRAITLCNSGVMAASAETMFTLLANVKNENASGEYYLTDVVGEANAAGKTCGFIKCAEEDTLGVNSKVELAAAEALFQTRARMAALENGVTLQAPETVFFSHDTDLAAGVTVEPNVVFGPKAVVKAGARIRAFSHVEGSEIGEDCVIGPYARVRPGSVLNRGAKLGNFVETKNATLDAGAKVNHLSYVGDAHVGAKANIGAGTITCNYDGVFKHKTTIGANAFIGSNTMLVAPVTVGDNAMTGSGSVITSDVPDGALGLGRAKQENKPGFATRLMNALRTRKAKGEK